MIKEKLKEKAEEKVEKKETRKQQIEEAVKSDVQIMKEALDKQPKVSFMIPLSEGENEGAYETVCLNGYSMKIKKGEMVELPKQVAEILADSYKIQMTAGSDKLISRSKEAEEALS